MQHVEVRRDEQIGWYEASLPLRERKKRGHFSTPPTLVERILDACGYTPDADLSHIRVLDPACGSGNFLAGAAQRLLQFGERMELAPQERAELIQRNIWGFDPDPVSCFLAHMQLSAITNDVCITGNPHMHQADSLALQWEPCVDLFLANPPYLAAKNNDLSGYRLAQQRGQADSYLLFLELALRVTRPAGWIGLVLPDPVLARLNAARERTQLLKQATLHHLWHLSGVFAAEVGAVVLIAQNTPAKSAHQVSWMRGSWRATSNAISSPANTQRIAQSLFLSQPAAELRYLLSSEGGVLLDRLRVSLYDASEGERCFAPLSEFVAISRGEELGRESPFLTPVEPESEIGAGTGPAPTLHETAFESAVQDRGGHPTPGPCSRYAVLRGGVDICPYGAPQASWWIEREAVTKPLTRYLSPKLLVVKSTDRLQATLDTGGHVALQTLYLLHMRSPQQHDMLYFLLALLNSRLLRAYVYNLHTAYKWVQPQIEQRVLANLPVPLSEPAQQRPIIEQARQLMNACSRSGAVVEWNAEITSMYEELERNIRALYAFALMEGM
jgi:SAM-dependent methyltransferase